jgi:hypothetical protein
VLSPPFTDKPSVYIIPVDDWLPNNWNSSSVGRLDKPVKSTVYADKASVLLNIKVLPFMVLPVV